MKENQSHDAFNMLNVFSQVLGTGHVNDLMLSVIQTSDIAYNQEPSYQKLGDGYELRPIELSEEEAKNKRILDLKYSYLYHNGLKVSDLIFRKGGTGGKFKDGYCELIHYTRTKEPKKNDNGFSFGNHVIINNLGEIKMEMKGGLSYPHHIGGHLASIDNYIYDLRTGEAIAPKSSTTIIGKNSIIVDHRYNWYDKEVKLPVGVYRIDFLTAEVTKIDDIGR